jgi:hypothetical protein
MTALADRIRAGKVSPWVGDGADGCRRSAQVVADELATLPTGPHQPGYHDEGTENVRATLEAQRDAWLDRAARLEEGAP